MSLELSLLKLFCDTRKAEAENYGYMDTLDNLERELRLLFNLVHSYYKEYEKDSIRQGELLSYYELKYPRAAAICKGVQPFLFRTFTSAPLRINILTISICP